jgi:hypothetical protein
MLDQQFSLAREMLLEKHLIAESRREVKKLDGQGYGHPHDAL